MTVYYYESKRGKGEGQFESDIQAIAAWSTIPGLLIIYTENESGSDFRIIWERNK